MVANGFFCLLPISATPRANNAFAPLRLPPLHTFFSAGNLSCVSGVSYGCIVYGEREREKERSFRAQQSSSRMGGGHLEEKRSAGRRQRNGRNWGKWQSGRKR